MDRNSQSTFNNAQCNIFEKRHSLFTWISYPRQESCSPWHVTLTICKCDGVTRHVTCNTTVPCHAPRTHSVMARCLRAAWQLCLCHASLSVAACALFQHLGILNFEGNNLCCVHQDNCTHKLSSWYIFSDAFSSRWWYNVCALLSCIIFETRGINQILPIKGEHFCSCKNLWQSLIESWWSYLLVSFTFTLTMSLFK